MFKRMLQHHVASALPPPEIPLPFAIACATLLSACSACNHHNNINGNVEGRGEKKQKNEIKHVK